MIDSDQCGGIMGSQELLLYPIRDSVIRSFDWESKQLTAISKKNIIRAMNVSEPMFIDALLMTGTTFLPPFPPLQDTTIIRNQPFTIMDAVNLLRTSDKSVTNACASFNDILQAQDPAWLDKYRKARMSVNHFIYIAESGEIQVNDYEHLTGDNHEYLGLQLPSELFHYLNTGLIGSRNLGYVTHGQILVLPTLDGVVSTEYKKLVTSQLVPIKEQTLALLIPRLHRAIQHKNITMKVWFDEKYSYTINHRTLNPPPHQRVGTWDVKESSLKQFFPSAFPGLISTEVLALRNLDFVKTTFAKEKIIRGIDSADIITSISIWRFLHLRGYVNDEHNLTVWGQALAKACLAIKETQKELYYDQRALYEAVLIAFELIRFELLNGRNQHEELRGLPLNGSDHDKNSLLLISRCATLLKLRHEANGYTGPLNKNLLAFRSLSSAVRETDRDLVEAIVASMFMWAQSKRDRDDQLEISRR
jgi:Temperature dependent protein affecting M2 dsRNA replication